MAFCYCLTLFGSLGFFILIPTSIYFNDDTPAACAIICAIIGLIAAALNQRVENYWKK